MKYPPHEARVVLVDGPVALYIHPAPTPELTEAMDRLLRLFATTVSAFEAERMKTGASQDGPRR